MNIRIIALSMLLAVASAGCKQTSNEIDLAGEWQVALDSLDRGIAAEWYSGTFADKINLPGTLCDAGYGTPCTLQPTMEKEIFLNLKRNYDYVGTAWYRKEVRIPSEWEGKDITLKLERVIWNSQVWVNGQKVEGISESLSTPHYFNLSQYLIPGQSNSVVVRIDNSKQHDISVNNLAHAYTNDTQTMWNGILGQIKLAAKDRIYINQIQLTPDIDNNKVNVSITTAGNDNNAVVSRKLTLTIEDKDGNKLPSKEIELTDNTVSFDYPIENPRLWDEFNPHIYKVTAQLQAGDYADTKTETFGMRKLTNKDALLQINGRRMFLRGTLECCIFPLTGYPPTDKAGWQKVFGAAREYGMNHLRFHSWCPPKAAFEVADEMGFYIQVELPLWVLTVGQDAGTVDFLYGEAARIMKEYGNHPSFCFWSLGNELEGDFAVMDKLLTSLKEQDSRHLYTTTSFTFQAGHGSWPEPNDEFWVSQWTSKGWARGQGIFDDEPASFNKDYSTSIEGLPVPIITHEIGQYSVFPNLKEIDKYTGNLQPLNFIAVANDLEKKGRRAEAEDYLMASGKLAVILYKEEIERALKTPGFSGFQLLDLHDFPGQGTALVGIIDAFWESKGLITPEKFREFCSPVVPLARFGKATYTNNETFTARFEVANFSDRILQSVTPSWKLSDANGIAVAQGELNNQDIAIGNALVLGDVSVPLNTVQQARKLTISIQLAELGYKNSWDIWVYPQELEQMNSDVLYTRSFAEAANALGQGRKVLLNPDIKDINGLDGKFVQVFWSPVHFPNQPGTMGILCDPQHPALAHFPTEMHSNWQWWDICKQAKTMELDAISTDLKPVVRMVDNFFKNRNLGLVFEANAGNGKLLVCSSDLSTNLDARPVARQLHHSLLKYMESDTFNPEATIEFEQIKDALHNTQRTEQVKKSIYD